MRQRISSGRVEAGCTDSRWGSSCQCAIQEEGRRMWPRKAEAPASAASGQPSRSHRGPDVDGVGAGNSNQLRLFRRRCYEKCGWRGFRSVQRYKLSSVEPTLAARPLASPGWLQSPRSHYSRIAISHSAGSTAAKKYWRGPTRILRCAITSI